MVAARKQWESQTLLAIRKATRVGLPKKVTKLATEASILPMMAYDGFISVLALCLGKRMQMDLCYLQRSGY